MARVGFAIRRLARWRDLDAIVFPAGYFRGDHSFAPQPAAGWVLALNEYDPVAICRWTATRLRSSSPGCLIVVGLDMPMVVRGRRGDQLLTAWDEDCLVGCARKFFPVDDATEASAYPIFLEDMTSRWRFVTLASGAKAALWVCYDAWAPGAILTASSKRRGMRYSLDPAGRWTTVEPEERDHALAELTNLLADEQPNVALVGIHKFARPGREIYWQRHGLAPASAALDGALCVGASHFTEALPSVLQSPLAARRVQRDHLTAGHARRTEPFAPKDGFVVALPDDPSRKALVRLFQSR